MDRQRDEENQRLCAKERERQRMATKRAAGEGVRHLSDVDSLQGWPKRACHAPLPCFALPAQAK
jgi:hypothetical protein